MPSSTLSFALAILTFTGVVSSAPTASGTPPSSGKSFTVSQVKNRHHVRNGPLALAKTYRKYGRSLPRDLEVAVAKITRSASRKRDVGTVEAVPEDYDSEFLSPVEIGNPPQTLVLDFDSGSSDLWVFSSNLERTNGQALYDPAKSNTSTHLPGYSWAIRYGDGSSSSGDVYTDVVSIGGLSVEVQAVETADTVSSMFLQDMNLDGLLGLGFSDLNTVSPEGQLTWFDNIADQLDSKVWTVDFKNQKPGTYTFGEVDSSKYTGEIAYAPVDPSLGYWLFTSTGYGTPSTEFTTMSLPGIADTGTTLLLLPDEVCIDYWEQVEGAGYDRFQAGFVFPCGATLPDFEFGVGDAKITVPGEYMNFAPVSTTYCYGGIQSDFGIGFSIYGAVALKAAFVVFDVEGERLGWAAKKI